MNTPSNSQGSVVINANVLIATCSKEADRHSKAEDRLKHYGQQGWHLYAPGVIVAETLYMLCGKYQNGLLTSSEHATATQTFQIYMGTINMAPSGDGALIKRAEEIRSGYGCSRSADSIYLALAEELLKSGPGELLTFDQDLQKQATKNCPDGCHSSSHLKAGGR
jgi:predicted nucleic acid-binding protein